MLQERYLAQSNVIIKVVYVARGLNRFAEPRIIIVRGIDVVVDVKKPRLMPTVTTGILTWSMMRRGVLLRALKIERDNGRGEVDHPRSRDIYSKKSL